MRRAGFGSVLFTLRLVALVATVVTFTYMNQRGVTPHEGYSTFTPTWVPSEVGAAVHESGITYAAPWICITGAVTLWFCYFMASRAIRREFPREVYP